MEHLLLLIIKKEKKRLVGDVGVVCSCAGAPIFRTFPALLFFYRACGTFIPTHMYRAYYIK